MHGTREPPIETEALEALDPYPMDQALLHEAWRLEDRHALPYWDAMIVAAAELSECETLYSEDMSHGAQYGAVRIVNPFVQARGVTSSPP